MRKSGAVIGVGALALALAGQALAGTGAKPARVTLEAGMILQGLVEQRIVEAGGALLSVAQNAAGIHVVRGGNHVIGPEPGKSLNLLRAAGDPDGSVLVWYESGLTPRLRKIKADNQLGFDVKVLGERLAGVAHDGAGGAYHATHVGYATDGFWIDATKHRTTRLDASGQIVWQVSEEGGKKPTSSSAYWTTTTRSAAGVMVGYGVARDDGTMMPVVLHRAAADGAVLWRRAGLKAPAAAAVGTPGGTELRGRVDQVFLAKDGSPVLVVYEDGAGDQYLTRLDAAGAQTAVYPCEAPRPHPSLDIACVDFRPATAELEVVRYGVVGAGFGETGRFVTQALPGLKLDQVAFTPGGQVLVSARKNESTLVMALFSGAGKLLTKYDQGVAGGVHQLQTSGGTWLGHGFDVLPALMRFHGTFSAGGAPPPVTRPGEAPKLAPVGR